MLDIARIGAMAHAHGALQVIDASQTAGAAPIDMQKMGIDVLCFLPATRGLMGPQGTGGLCIRPGVKLRPLLRGGTGVHSYDREQPKEYPARLEAGTLNGHGLAGLHAALDFYPAAGRGVHRRTGAAADAPVLRGRSQHSRRDGLRRLHRAGARCDRDAQHPGLRLGRDRGYSGRGLRHRDTSRSRTVRRVCTRRSARYSRARCGSAFPFLIRRRKRTPPFPPSGSLPRNKTQTVGVHLGFANVRVLQRQNTDCRKNEVCRQSQSPCSRERGLCCIKQKSELCSGFCFPYRSAQTGCRSSRIRDYLFFRAWPIR